MLDKTLYSYCTTVLLLAETIASTNTQQLFTHPIHSIRASRQALALPALAREGGGPSSTPRALFVSAHNACCHIVGLVSWS